MTQLQGVRTAYVPAPVTDVAASQSTAQRRAITSSVAVFLLLSGLFGILTLVLTPPLRGPDELPHFLRAYGISLGEIIPSTTDAQGRKGVFIPATLHRDMQLYQRALEPLYRKDHVTFPEVLADYARRRAEGPSSAPGSATSPAALSFALYAGSEGYSPVAYLPYLPGLALGRVLELDFLTMFYLTRPSGFVIITTVMAFAIALVPHLQWPFLFICMLPSALFSRAVLSTDDTALAATMVVAALALRAAHGLYASSAWTRALWMTLCVLCKPPQLAFILLEAMRAPLRRLVLHWRHLVLVVGPAVVLALMWTALSSADVAAWRLVNGSTISPEHYAPLWKLRFLLGEPWHFPLLLAGTWHYLDDYARQLIGVLGWLDMPLRPWLYPVLGTLLVAAFWGPFELDRLTRRRLAAVAVLTVLGYTLAVFMIFYLVWTGLDQDQIEGVQGRYFVVVLPLVAVIFAASLKRGPSGQARMSFAIIGAVLSGCATVDAVLRSDWKLALLPL